MDRDSGLGSASKVQEPRKNPIMADVEIQSDSDPCSGEAFPRGFLLDLRSRRSPSGFINGPLDGLTLSPSTRVQYRKDSAGRFVVVLGTCVSTLVEESEEESASRLFDAYVHGEQCFLEALDDYAGRYAIIFGGGEAVRVVQDATAMRSVFYGTESGIAGSAAYLVEWAQQGAAERDDFPFYYGYPGNLTPYEHTRILTPNTVLDVRSGSVKRFWPRHVLPERDPGQVAREILDRATTAMRNMATSRPMKIAMTAGRDSRALFAVVLNSRISCECFTFGLEEKKRVDHLVASEICSRHGISHTSVATFSPNRDKRALLHTASYDSRHGSAVAGMSAWVGDEDVGAVNASLLEIGRSFFRGARRAGASVPDTPEGMSALHLRSMGGARREQVSTATAGKWVELAEPSFNEMYRATEWGEAAAILDAFDLFYWEHRMCAWLGPVMNERDFYAEPLNPFNARSIFEAMLSVPQDQRDGAEVLMNLIDLVDPHLMDIPINPKSWPPNEHAAPFEIQVQNGD